MKQGRLVLDACKPVSEETYRAWTRRMKPIEGDLVLAREAPVGDVIRVPNTPRVCLGQRTVLIRPDPTRVDPRFLQYWLLGPDAQGDMHGRAAGATVPHLNVEDIRQLDVIGMLKDRQRQRAVGSVLGAIDDLIENNRRRIMLLEQLAQTIYREWFVNFRYAGHEDDELVDSPLGPIPADWEVVRLADVVEEIRDAVSPSAETASMPYVPIDAITPKSITLRSHRPGSEAASSLRRFSQGDILFGAMRAYFHKVCVAPFAGVTRSTSFVLRPDPQLYHYLVLVLADETTVSYAASHSSGSTIPYAKWAGGLHDMNIARPPSSLAAAFGEIVAPIVALTMPLAAKTNELGEIRDLLLPKLVTGAIDVSHLDLDALLEDTAA